MSKQNAKDNSRKANKKITKQIIKDIRGTQRKRKPATRKKPKSNNK